MENVLEKLFQDARYLLARNGLSYPEERTRVQILPWEAGTQKYKRMLQEQTESLGNKFSDSELKMLEYGLQGCRGHCLTILNGDGLEYFVIAKYNTDTTPNMFPGNCETVEQRLGALQIINTLIHEIGGHIWFKEHTKFGRLKKQELIKLYRDGIVAPYNKFHSLEESWAEIAALHCCRQHPLSRELYDLLRASILFYKSCIKMREKGFKYTKKLLMEDGNLYRVHKILGQRDMLEYFMHLIRPKPVRI